MSILVRGVKEKYYSDFFQNAHDAIKTIPSGKVYAEKLLYFFLHYKKRF